MCWLSSLRCILLPFLHQCKPTLLRGAPSTPAEQTPAVDIETVQFTAEGISLTMSAPAKWTHVIRQGADAYINPADGATLFFHIGGYDPGVNMVTEEIIASELSASGGLLGGFSRDGNSAYLAIYEQGGCRLL